jgi:RHS repeat-associated protein
VLLASTGSTVNPHTYVGRERYYRMPNAEMYHLGFRDYAQGLGRFVTRDPLFAAQEPYAYVVSRPTAGIDLLGLTQCYNFPIAEFSVSRCVQHYLEPGCCSVHCEDWDVGFSSELLDLDPWRDLPVSFNDVMDYARILWRVMKELSTKGGPTRDPRPTRGCPASIESWGDARICLTACGVFSSHQICATTPDLTEGLEPRPHPRWTVEKDVTVAWCGVPRVEVSIQAHFHNCGLPGDRDDSRGITW